MIKYLTIHNLGADSTVFCIRMAISQNAWKRSTGHNHLKDGKPFCMDAAIIATMAFLRNLIVVFLEPLRIWPRCCANHISLPGVDVF